MSSHNDAGHEMENSPINSHVPRLMKVSMSSFATSSTCGRSSRTRLIVKTRVHEFWAAKYVGRIAAVQDADTFPAPFG